MRRTTGVLVVVAVLLLGACESRNASSYPTPPLVDAFSPNTTGDCGPGLLGAWYDEGTQADQHGPRAIQIIEAYGGCIVMAGRGNWLGADYHWWFVWYTGGPSPDELDDLVRG